MAPVASDAGALEERYEIAETADALSRATRRSIALQFPDDLLTDAPAVCERLQATIGGDVKVFVLGDTSYGSCCVDETAAEHLQADVVVHYGPTCLSPTSRIPAYFVFGREPLETGPLVAALQGRFPADQPLVVVYEHVVKSQPHPAPANAEQALVILASLPRSSCLRIAGLSVALPEGVQKLSQCAILYIGGEGPKLTSLLLHASPSLVVGYLPGEGGGAGRLRDESVGTNRALAKRYHLVERARAADIVGILVGTLGVAGYADAVAATRALVAAAGRKSYTFVVGKPNPAKLANFPEVDVFVLIACEENTLMDSKELLKPVVTPYELLSALAPGWQWTGEYSTSFRDLLPMMQSAREALLRGDAGAEGDDEPLRMSLATGRMLKDRDSTAGRMAQADSASGEQAALVVREAAGALSTGVSSPAADFLQGRSFQGLEMRVGADAPQLAVKGRSGIASRYDDER
eukprot:tig00000704_g3310.t1